MQQNGLNRVLPNSILTVLISSYGPIAFGLISVLIIWITIVDPVLKVNRVDTQSLNQAVVTLQQGTENIKQAAQANERTAQTMKTVTENLLRLERNRHDN